MKRRAAVLAILAAAVALGALREFLFINLNYQIAFATHRYDESYAHSMFQRWVGGWDAGALFSLKWILALAFAMAMLLLCILLARALAGSHRYAKSIALAYLAVILTSLACHLLGQWLDHPAVWDILSVKLGHLLQYPVVLFFIWAASLLPREA